MRYIVFSLLPFFFFCQNRPSNSALTVVLDQAALRESPGEKSRTLQLLKDGESLEDLGAVSPFEASVRFADGIRQAPWIQVKTADGTSGWVFGGAVAPDDLRPDWLLQKRLLCYFGPVLTARRNALVAAPVDLPDETALAHRYRTALALRDTFAQVLAHRPEPSGADIRLDFAWLAHVLPGFVFQQVADGTQVWLFADYRRWASWAQSTAGGQDDAYFAACCAAFSTDSIESFFPMWQFQLSDREAASRLGEGRHLTMLQTIDQAMSAGSLFAPELAALTTQVLEDIFGKNTRYWQPKEKIVSELEKIIATRLRCLDDADRSELRLRLAMFDNPAATEIQVNLRSGASE